MKSKIIKLLIASVAVLLLLWLLDDSNQVTAGNTIADLLPSVSVLSVSPKQEQTRVRVLGLVKSRWQVEVTANVRGEIVDSFEGVLPGTHVNKGQVIAQIDDLEYRAALATAKANEAAARLELARILNEQSVAKRLDSGTNNNDYRLHKPHVEAAKASLIAAQENVAAALKQLNDTKIKAPFDAVVLTKHIAPSKQINMGEHVYTLASSSAIDVEVSLSSQQWQRTNIDNKTSVEVTDVLEHKWQANIRYLAPVLNNQTRQRGVTLTIENPYQGEALLLPEQQVEVNFLSNPIDNAVIAPATVLSRDNKVWVVEDSKLVLEQVNILEESAESVMFTFVNEPQESRQIVLFPLSTMLNGQSVTTSPVAMAEGE